MEKMNKILWIDDDIKRRELRTDIDEFEYQGYQIVPAANPDELETIISSQTDFECLIIDISMPTGKNIDFGEAKGGMRTGLVVLKKLVNNPKFKEVKKVVYTIVDDEETRNYCEDNNIPYLEKQNYLPDSFVAEIKKILKS